MRLSLSFFVAALLPTALSVAVAVPPGASAAPSAPAKACPAEAADEVAAVRAAAACHGRVEVAADRDEKTQVFANANGSFTAKVSALVQRVRDSRGQWVRPDATLRRTADGRLTPAAASLRLSFSGGGTGPAVTIGKDDAQLSLAWSTALPAPTVRGADATYADVMPGVDLVLTAQPEGFSEVLVVKNAAAAAQPALAAVRFTTTSTGLTLRQDASGALAAVDATGATLFGSGAPAMWDSSPSREPGAARSGRTVPGEAHATMPVQLAETELILHPDLAMLRDQTTRFPVYIDPAIGRTSWTMINSKFPTQSYWSFDRSDCPAPYASIQCAKVGYTTSPTAMIYRSMFSFGVSSLLHKHIQSAILSMDTVYSYDNTNHGTQVRVTNGISQSTTWSNNASTWGATVVATANSHAYDRVRRRTEWGVASAVQTAAGGTGSTLTLGLREVSETDVKNWKKFDAGTALLTVTYNSYPNKPDTITVGGNPCVTGAGRPYVRTLTPAVKARLTDPDGTVRLLKGTFLWWNFTGGAPTASNQVSQASIVSGQYATATIPAGKLTDGGIYVVKAIANDGIDNGQYSTTCEFQVDVTAPNPPSAVTSTDYPNDGQMHGGAGTAGTFVFQPPATVPADFSGYAYSTDPAAAPATATHVAAAATDHTATVSLTPVADQTYNLRVWALDKAGNFSAPIVYQFSVRPGAGPDARWTFDSQDGGDNSQHGNTATVNGGTWAAGRGSYGSAFVGDGTTAYTATAGSLVTKDPATGAPTTVHSNASFTISAVVRLDSTAGSGQRVILAQDGVHTSPFLLSYSVTDKKWRFGVAASDVDAPTTVALLSNAVATTGVWTRLLATYDGTSHALKLYVNGVLQTATGTSATFDATGPVTVGRGRAASVPTGYFPGAIDDVRIYSRVLLTTEQQFALLQLPNPPIVTLPSGPSGYTGQAIPAVISAGGDTAVTKVKYQLDASGAATTVTLPAAGGQTTANLTSTTPGRHTLLAYSIDAAGNTSPFSSTDLTYDQAPGVTGLVTDANGAAVAGASVVLTPGDLTATTTSTGAYSFTGITAGTYTITASFGGVGCLAQMATTEVDVSHAVIVDLMVAPESDYFGYTCKATSSLTPFVPGTTKLALTGDDEQQVTALPFTMPFYGKAYGQAWISTNGILSFMDSTVGRSYVDVSLPDRKDAPRAAIAPLWDDLVVDASAGVYTATVGTGPAQQYVVEWRNVRFYGTTTRATFEAILNANGDVTLNYSGVTTDLARGSNALVGITSPGGHYAVQYSFDQPVLASNKAVTVAYPVDPQPLVYGALTGTVSRDGVPLRYVQVVLEEYQDQSVLTDASGQYRFDDLEQGDYRVEARAGCDHSLQPEASVYGDTVVDLPMTSRFVDPFGYYCDVETASWIPGVTPLINEVDADGNPLPYTLPFPFPFYGRTYSTARSVDPFRVYIRDPADSSAYGYIEFAPDWGISCGEATCANYQTYLATIGTAPNRQFVVEARNVTFADRPTVNFSAEMVFGEDGTVRMVIDDPGRTLPYNVSAWIYGSESDLEYFEDGGGFPDTNAVVFRPPATP